MNRKERRAAVHKQRKLDRKAGFPATQAVTPPVSLEGIPEPGLPFPSLSSISLSSAPVLRGADTRVCSAETLLGAFSTSATNSRLSQPFHGDGISPAQLTANRANAQHSTGPKTGSGRAISSPNRTTHGLARHNGAFILLPSEDPAGFEALKTSLAEEHEPSTETESILVATMAESHWLANRAQNLQTTCFDQTTGQITNEKLFSLYLRYQTTHTRAFHKSLNDLLKLRSERRKEQNGFEAQTRKNEEIRLQNERHEMKKQTHYWEVIKKDAEACFRIGQNVDQNSKFAAENPGFEAQYNAELAKHGLQQHKFGTAKAAAA